MATRNDIINELQRRMDAGEFSDSQRAAYSELQRRGVIPQAGTRSSTPPPSDPFTRVIEQSSLSDQDKTRLMRTGVTPGTAAEWTAAHESYLRNKGIEVTPERRMAIFDIYKQKSGRSDLSNRDFFAEAQSEAKARRRETILGRFADAGAAFNQNLADTGLNILGAVAPETANKLGQNVQDVYGTDPNSRAAAVGSFVAEAPKLYAAAAAGPLGMAGIYGEQGVGSTRREIADLRNQGVDISGWQEALSASLVGGTEAASGFIGGKVFQAMGRTLQAVSPTLRSALAAGEEGAVKKLVGRMLTLTGEAFAEGTEEAVTQLVENRMRQGYNPEAALSEGVKEAFIGGLLLSPIGAAGARHTGLGIDENISQATEPQTDVERRLVGMEGTRPAETAIEQQLVGQQATPPTQVEQDAFFGTGVSEPTLQEEAQFLRREGQRTETDLPLESAAARRTPPVSPPQTPQESRWIGRPFTGDQATPPRRRRASASYPTGFDEGQFFAEDEVTKLKRELADERKLSRTDSLTGLGNKREYDESLAKFKQRTADTGKPFSVLLFDAANLKAANDLLGHEGADQLLKDLGITLRTASKRRTGDAILTRQGGDEFAVILPDTDKAGAKKVLTKIEQAAGRKQLIPGLSMFFAGDVATYTGQEDFDAVLRNADHGVEAKKRLLKQRFGEVTERSQAEQLVSQHKATPETPTPTPMQTPSPVEQLAPRITKGRTVAVEATPIQGTQHKRRVPRALEEWLTPVSSRIRDISASVFNRLMRMEFDTDVARERLKKELSGPATRLRTALRKAGQEDEFKLLVSNQQFEAARTLLRGINSELVADFDTFDGTFQNLLAQQREAGVTIGDVPNYWPRSIRDYRALKAEFGEDDGRFEEAWNLARKVKGRAVLTAEEKAEIANNTIQGFGPRKPGSYGPSHARARSVDEVTREALPHYIDPFEAAFRYIDGATYAVERSRFLGKNHTLDNLDETVGNIVQQEVDAGRLTKDQQDELHDLLTTRFTADMLKTRKAVRNFKQLVYLTTLGQFRSTLTQLTDVAMTAASHGIVNTVKGLRAAVHLGPRDRRILMEDIGVHDHGEEFKDIGKIARATDWVLRATGFKAIDRLGKENRINAAWSNFTKIASNPSSTAYKRLEREYRPVLGEDFDQTMHDLRQGKKTENVRYLLFLDITKVQPVTTSQMPARYLQMPNGRTLYAMKTFTLMQLDHVRRDMLRKIATPGHRKEGMAHLGRYVVFFTLLGVGVDLLKDLISGREVTPDQIPDRAVNAMLGTVGMNRYTVERGWTDPADAAINYVAPPLSWVTAPWQDITTGAAGGLRSIRNMPIVGELLYYWAPFGRGNQLNAKQVKTDYRKRLKDLRKNMGDALRTGDTQLARDLLVIYNERRRQGPGDGRTNPLTLQDIQRDIRKGETDG